MRYAAFVLCALLMGCIPSTRCPVIIGFGGYTYSAYTIGGDAAGAAFLSSTDALSDGKPATVTRCQFINGPLTSSSATRISTILTTPDGHNPLVGVIAALNVSLPIGTFMKVYDAAHYPAPGSLVGTTSLQLGNNGIPQGWVTPPDNVSIGSVIIEFVNNTGDITANEEFTIGEIFVGEASYWGVKRDIQMGYANTGKTRVSSAGVSWPIMQPQIRTMQANLSPIAQKEAFASATATIDMATLCTSIFNSDVVAVIPFENFDPALYGFTVPYGAPGWNSTPEIVCKTAYLAQLTQPPSIRGNGQQYYDVAMSFQESI